MPRSASKPCATRWGFWPRGSLKPCAGGRSGGGRGVFRGSLTTDPARALDLLIARFRPFGYTPYLREEAGGAAVQAWPVAETAPRGRIGVNLALFALTVLAILGVHELGHYFTARHYKASVSLPYFIPAPFLFSTLGAIILMRSPARDRNSLFDIAAAGPLAGLAVALPAGL